MTAVPTVQDGSPPSRRDMIARAAFDLSLHLDPERIGTGGMAELRRMEASDGFLPATFWRLLFRAVPDEIRGSAPSHDRAWALLIHTMALIGPKPHATDARFGQALAETGYSEARFVRMLRTDDHTFEKDLRASATWLADYGKRIDCRGLARFILSKSQGFQQGFGLSPSHETHRLARDYFGVSSSRAFQE